jgi:hypothetical protein
VCVSKYGGRSVKAVVIHPDDFELFVRLLDLLGEVRASEMTISETALLAHRLGETGADDPELDVESLRLAIGE